jgi:glycosyltransferase involved in cell wall biosynthesis
MSALQKAPNGMVPIDVAEREIAATLRVVHVVLSMDCGGLERVVLSLVSKGVGVICVERPGALAPQVEVRGGWVACVEKRPGLRPSAIAALRRILLMARPAIIHTHQIGALVYAGPASRGVRGAHVVHTEHGRHYDGPSRTHWLGRVAGSFAKRFFCVSRDIADGVTAHHIAPRHKIVVVPNGIDTTRLTKRDEAKIAAVRSSLGIPPSAPVVGTIGRLSEIKRQDVLLRAFARLRTVNPEAHLVIVGDGPMMPTLQSLARDLQLESACHLVGYQSEPEVYLQLMQVFALTSRSEGMPLAVLEAWAASVPVVATRVGGLSELITDSHNGILFEPGDDAALSAAFERILLQPEVGLRMAEQGRAVVESEFSVQRMAGVYASHYEKLLGSRSPVVDA